jgi:hypothetical protein
MPGSPAGSSNGHPGTGQIGLSTIWTDAALKRTLMDQPKSTLRKLGFAIPDDVAVKALGSRGAPSDRGDTLLQFVVERGPRFAFFFLPSPLHPSAQQAAYGRTVGNDVDDPVFERRARADAAAALQELAALRPADESAIAAR